MNKETRAALERLEAQLLEIDQQQAQTEEQRLDSLLEDFSTSRILMNSLNPHSLKHG